MIDLNRHSAQIFRRLIVTYKWVRVQSKHLALENNISRNSIRLSVVNCTNLAGPFPWRIHSRVGSTSKTGRVGSEEKLSFICYQRRKRLSSCGHWMIMQLTPTSTKIVRRPYQSNEIVENNIGWVMVSMNHPIKLMRISHTMRHCGNGQPSPHDLIRLPFIIPLAFYFSCCCVWCICLLIFRKPRPSDIILSSDYTTVIHTHSSKISIMKKNIYLSSTNHTTNYNLPKLHHKKGNLCLIGAPSSINQWECNILQNIHCRAYMEGS